jgi:hypothetical protein
MNQKPGSAQLRIVPFGTLEAFVVIAAPQPSEPQAADLDSIRLLDGNTTAQTEILSFPSFSQR